MQKIKIDWNYWLIRFLFVMAVIIGYCVITNFQVINEILSRFFSVVSPFLLGFVFAYLLSGAQKRLENLLKKIQLGFFKKHCRGLSVLILYLILIYLFFVTLNYVIPLIVNNIVDLLNLLPTFYSYIMDLFDKLQAEGILEVIHIEDLLKTITADYSPEKLLSQWAQTLLSLGELTKNLSSLVFNAFLSLIISIYALVFKDSILSFTDKLAQKIFSKRIYQESKKWLQTTHLVFYRFISSQFIDACIMGILATLLLTILEVPFAVTLGILLGICNMIPYFGSIFASIVTTVITFFSGGWQLALTALFSLLILQQIDGNFIGPRIMSGALDLNPIIIIISITIGGAYFGVLGMFLAVPVAAILKIVTTNWLDEPNKTV
ncbi:MAG TPA: AI-2E family transporter [Tetragenococcus sp.]|nr:AI-2E family transporter [Tetragenococcus sp.]